MGTLAIWFDFGEVLKESHRPSEYICRVFSVLAASLFAIISIVSNPSMLISGGWKEAWVQVTDIQNRLLRLMMVFILYLVVLALLIFSEAVKEKGLDNWHLVHDIFAFFAVHAFFLSIFWLPHEICEIQMKRLDQEIISRRNRKQGRNSIVEDDSVKPRLKAFEN